MSRTSQTQVEIRKGSIVEGGKFQDIRRAAYYGVNKVQDAVHQATKKKDYTFACIHLDAPNGLYTELGVVKSVKDGVAEVYMYFPKINQKDTYWGRPRFIQFDSYPFYFPSQTPEINELYKQDTEYELARSFANNMSLPQVKITAIRGLKRRFQSYYNYVVTYKMVQ